VTIEEQFDRDEYVISLLNEIKDKQDLELKGRAVLLSQIAELKDYVLELLNKDKPVYNKQSDAQARHRERTW
jgi:hypothetical protein